MAKIRLKSGRWIFDCRINGSRKRISFESRRQAEEFAKEYRLRNEGLLQPADSQQALSIADAIRKYTDTVSVNKSKDTQGCEKNYFEQLYDFLLDEKTLFWMNDIRLIHLEEFQTRLRSKVSASTVNRYFNTYKNFFNKCERWSFVQRSPAIGLSRLKENPQERKNWTVQQMDSVLKEIPNWAGDVLYFIAATSARPGKEVQRIKWSDVDFAQGQCKVTAFKGTGEAMSRYLPLTENIIQFLHHKREGARKAFHGRDEDPVFVNSQGNVVESDVLDRIVRDACQKLGYTGLVPYGLRHTAFSDMVACDVSIEKIRRLAGHSKLTTTQKYLKTNVRQLHEALATASSGKLVRNGTNGH